VTDESTISTSRHGRRRLGLAVTAASAALVVSVLAFQVGLLHASAQNVNPCGPLWSAPSSDQANPKLDIFSGSLSDNSRSSTTPSLTTTLTIANLSAYNATSDAPGTANEYYFVWAFNGTSYYTNAESSPSGTTYSYGTYSSTTGFSGAGSATGSFNPGTNGTVTVTVPFSAIGNPVAGDAFSSAAIFGQTGQLTGAAGSGLVSTAEKDTSTYDYEVGQSCGTTPTPTATPVPTTTSPGGNCTAGSPELNVSQNGFICPVKIPSSGGLGEPSITHDTGADNGGVPRLFVTAPQSIGNVNTAGGSPLFTSTDGGLHWGAPIRSQLCTGLSGGDTDLATDPGGNVYHTDLWLGNSCMSVSTDHGSSFAIGNPYGQEVQPGDDRPWLAYSSTSFQSGYGQLYGTYDGFDGVHVVNTLPLLSPLLGAFFVYDNVAIPESLVSSSSIPNNVRACVCPPGGIAVDNSTVAGGHPGRVYISFSDQNGTAVARADPVGPTTPSGAWSYTFINDLTAGSAFQDEWNFSPIKVDSNGTVYVMWAHAKSFASKVAGPGGVQEYYAYSKDGGVTFSPPILLSTEDGVTGTGGTTVFPTLDVAAPGVLDTAWYGTTSPGDPNAVPATATWNVYYARVTNADTASPSFTPVVAVQDMHHGCIQAGGGASCADRSLLDFFQVTDDPGSPNIIYTAGDLSSGVNLWFTKLVSNGQQENSNVPETPYAAIVVLVGAGVAATAWRGARRRRQRRST
jgi:hypothetical protein